MECLLAFLGLLCVRGESRTMNRLTIRSFRMLVIALIVLISGSCGSPSSRSVSRTSTAGAGSPTPNSDNLALDFAKFDRASYKVKYEVEVGSTRDAAASVGYLTVSRIAAPLAQRLDASGDVARIGIDDASVVMLANGDTYYCSAHIPTYPRAVCLTGGAANEASELFLQGVGFARFGFASPVDVTKFTLRGSSNANYAGQPTHCYELGSVERESSSVELCLDSSGVPLHRRFSVGSAVVTLTATQAPQDASSRDVQVPYPTVVAE